MNCQFEICEPKNGRARVRCLRENCGNEMYGVDPGRCFAVCKALTRCVHLLSHTGEEATVVCLCPAGKRMERSYRVHACAIHGETLPNYQCTRESKEALSEWQEQSGRTIEIMTCRQCIAESLGYEPTESATITPKGVTP